MNVELIIIIVVVVLVIASLFLAPVFARRNKTQKFQKDFGTEYDRTVDAVGGEKNAQNVLKERVKHVDALDIRPLTAEEREHYLSDWKAVQSKFVDEPGQAVVEADRLIIEVMQLRNYPVSDFEQRAADISVKYPTLVTNYRAARDIATKNEKQAADTEELRQAMVYYKPLFDELLGTEAAAVEEKKV